MSDDIDRAGDHIERLKQRLLQQQCRRRQIFQLENKDIAISVGTGLSVSLQYRYRMNHSNHVEDVEMSLNYKE